MTELPGNLRVGAASELSALDAKPGTRVWVDSVGEFFEAIPQVAAPSGAVSGGADATPISWVLPQKGVPIESMAIAPGGAATTLWTLTLGASQSVTVEATLSASSDDGSTGGHLDGVLVCTAKRYKTGALDITSQSPALPWALNKSAWLPQFVEDGNSLLLQITPDAADTIQLRDSSVRYSVKDTSGDAAPAVHNEAWFFAQVNALLGSKVIDQFATPTGTTDVTGITGDNGLVMANADTGRYTVGTIGTQGRAATTAPSAVSACLRCAAVGQAVKSIASVCAIPTFPDATNYQVLFGTGGVSSATNKTMVQNTQSILIASGWTNYVNNVQTSALPTAGSIATIRADLASNTDETFQTGYATVPFVWRAPVGYWLLLNAAMSAGEAEAFEALAHGYFD
jgi:hypothetical protein